MFRNVFREFEEDPFFRGHNERVRGMLGAFRDPFSDFGTHALEGPDERHDRRERNRRSDTRDIVPRDMFHGMFRDLNSMVNNMQRNFAMMENDPNAYSYSSSSVMSYSNNGQGEPKYYQAAKSTRRAPGGIKESQHCVRDSETGIHKMAIGHHLGDRAHVIERSLDKKTNQEERHEKYLNMDESEAETFKRDWEHRTKHTANPLTQRHREDYTSVPQVRSKHRNRLTDHAPYQSHETRNDPGKDWDARELDVRGAKDGGAQKKKVRVNSRPTNKHSPRGGL